MRRLFLAAALLAAAAPLAAREITAEQPRGKAPPATAAVADAQRTAVEQALVRGRALAVIDQAGRLTTRDMLSRLADPAEAGIAGWIAQPEGNGITVHYFAEDGEDYRTVYRAQVIGGRVTAPQVYPADARPVLAGAAARMAAARNRAEALDERPCGGPAFNLLVLPPERDGPVSVYHVSPRMAAERVPAGGHFRTDVAADGSIASSLALGGKCADLTLTPVAAGQLPKPLTVDAPEAATPNEIHVFLSLWARRPLVVRTGTGETARLWGVTGEGIAELHQ